MALKGLRKAKYAQSSAVERNVDMEMHVDFVNFVCAVSLIYSP